MGKYRKQYDGDFKKNSVKLSHASPKTIKETAEDLGIHENLLYNWRRKYTAGGDKTKYATLEEENRDLQRQLAEVKMERDIPSLRPNHTQTLLKKATAYVCPEETRSRFKLY